MLERGKTRSISRGTCSLCGGNFSKAAMIKHLKTCQASFAPSTSKAATSTQPVRYYHLLVQGRYDSEYWLHLAARANATLTSLDSFLRNIWLECCGHLSQFEIQGSYYLSDAVRELDAKSMRAALEKVLQPDLKFSYEYDFGSTTALIVRVLGERSMPRSRQPILLLARNDPPVIPCVKCGASATKMCAECNYDDAGWLCDKCADEHECGEEMLLPVVNSPRVGVCGYTG